VTHAVLRSALASLEGLEGFRFACLVDAVTGTVVEAAPAGADPRHVEIAGAGSADLMRAITGMGAWLSPGGEVEDVVVTLSGACYVARLLAGRPAGPLALLLVIDRGSTALAFALREVRRLALAGLDA
jgi:hypothetical protein